VKGEGALSPIVYAHTRMQELAIATGSRGECKRINPGDTKEPCPEQVGGGGRRQGRAGY